MGKEKAGWLSCRGPCAKGLWIDRRLAQPPLHGAEEPLNLPKQLCGATKIRYLLLAMKKRTLGNTGKEVSEIGLGCWQLGGAEWGDVSDEQALAILGAAVDSGVTFFDTADVYGNGRSESLIGRFLEQSSTEIFVATKLGRMPNLYPDKYTEQGVREAIEASLARLGVEALDLIQLHCVPTEVMRQGEIFEWLRKLQKEGIIKSFGASVESMDEALLCLGQPGLASLQIIFNIFRQKPIGTLFPQAREKGVGIIVRLPLASGLLSGKFTKETKFGAKDHRSFNRDGQEFNVGETFAGIPFEKAVELAEEMKAFVPEGISMVQLAQRWILDHQAVSVIIPGASSVEQAKQNARASDLPALPRQLHELLGKFYRTKVERFIRGPY
jgi:aryl-alcohol dehydrogenase-like predicted oxidoreductase